jgi:hypothetical protein
MLGYPTVIPKDPNFLRVLQEHLEEEHIQAVLKLMEMAAYATMPNTIGAPR